MRLPDDVTRPVSVLALYRQMWAYAAGARGLLVLSSALLGSSQLIKLLVPWLTAQAINTCSAAPCPQPSPVDNPAPQRLNALPMPGGCLMSLLDRFDRVVLIVQGRIVDSGSAAELADRQVQFRAMVGAETEAEADVA